MAKEQKATGAHLVCSVGRSLVIARDSGAVSDRYHALELPPIRHLALARTYFGTGPRSKPSRCLVPIKPVAPDVVAGKGKAIGWRRRNFVAGTA